MLAAIVALIAYLARNAPGLLVESPDGTAVTAAAAARIAMLQMSTMAGVAVAATGGAAVAGFISNRRGEEIAATLEPSAGRRWLARYVAVLAFLLVSLIATAVAVFVAAALQAERLDQGAEWVSGDWATLREVFLHGVLAIATLPALGILVATLLRGSPAIAAAAAVGATQAMLLLEHLAGHRGETLVPTAWLSRWMNLPARDFGVGYYWTSGSFNAGRMTAGAGVALLAVAAGLVGWLALRRGARG